MSRIHFKNLSTDRPAKSPKSDDETREPTNPPFTVTYGNILQLTITEKSMVWVWRLYLMFLMTGALIISAVVIFYHLDAVMFERALHRLGHYFFPLKVCSLPF